MRAWSVRSPVHRRQALPVITIFNYVAYLSLTSQSLVSGHHSHCQTTLKPHDSVASRSLAPKILCRAVRCRAIGTSTIGTHSASQHFGCKYFLTAMHEEEKGIWTDLGPVEIREQGARALGGFPVHLLPTGPHTSPNQPSVTDPVCEPSIDASGRIAGKKAQKGRGSTSLAQRGE